MATSDNVTYQIVSVELGGKEFELPFGASVSDVVQFLPITYGTNVYAQCLAIVGRSVDCDVVNLGLSSSPEAGEKGTFKLRLRECGGTDASIEATNIKRGTSTYDAHSPPYARRTSCTNEGTPVLTISV